MKIDVVNQSIATSQVIYNDQGFAKPSGLPEVMYEISLSIEELQECFGQEFDDYVLECKADDEKYDDVDIPELKEVNYPKLKEALQNHPDLVVMLIKEYLYFNLFEKLLNTRERDNWKFAINSITDVLIMSGTIKVAGFGYWLSELN